VSPLRRFASAAAPVGIGTLVLLVLLEVGVRALGAPHGLFRGFLPGEDGLYPPNATIEMIWGPIPYRVTTNALGFRGPVLEREPTPGRTRIAAIGDSVTDGFFVDDEATYPARLQAELDARGVGAEVVNAARGSASIDKETAILREAVLPLDPEVVLLTVVTNDVSDLAGRTAEQVRSAQLRRGSPPLSLWLMTSTGLGELAYDAYLRVASESYRERRARTATGAARYEIPGGDSFTRNVRIFERRYAETDGLVLEDPLRPETQRLLQLYADGLDHFLAVCAEQELRVGLVYFPAYPEIYGKARATALRALLADRARERGARFLDLTPVFEREGEGRVLHLAPIDFHPNPAGNQVMAKATAAFVVEVLLP